MADVVEVIKGLGDIQKHLDTGYSYAIYWNSNLIRDTLELLKDKEAVEPIIMDQIVFGTTRKCSKCNRALFPAGRYCPHCGRPVKWE